MPATPINALKVQSDWRSHESSCSSVQRLRQIVPAQTIMQPAGVSAPGTAPYTGLGAPGASDGRGIEGAGIGLETDQLITRDQSPTAAKNPYLDKNRSGAESSGLSPLSPGGV